MTTDRFVLQRLTELEAKVDHMYRQLTGHDGGSAAITPMPHAGSGVSDAVREAARSGNMIEAIRLQRAETGQSLAEAKDALAGTA